MTNKTMQRMPYAALISMFTFHWRLLLLWMPGCRGIAYLIVRRKSVPRMFGRLFQKKMVDQDQFTSGPYVAVWVGHHTSEDQLDDYLFSGRFSEEFRFRIEDRRLPETCVQPTPKPLGELVHGFSRYQKFQDEFLQKASALGITSATSMMVFYFMVYSPDGLPVARKPEMTFVGNFWFEGFE